MGCSCSRLFLNEYCVLVSRVPGQDINPSSRQVTDTFKAAAAEIEGQLSKSAEPKERRAPCAVAGIPYRRCYFASEVVRMREDDICQECGARDHWKRDCSHLKMRPKAAAQDTKPRSSRAWRPQRADWNIDLGDDEAD